mgnify:CR=1 FL=1
MDMITPTIESEMLRAGHGDDFSLEGQNAKLMGKSESDCPYDRNTNEAYAYVRWTKGFHWKPE